jgi:hypothetical protein
MHTRIYELTLDSSLQSFPESLATVSGKLVLLLAHGVFYTLRWEPSLYFGAE